MFACKDPYGATEKAAADIGSSIAGGMKTVDSMRVSGLISTAEESSILGYLEFANTGDKALGTCAQQAHLAGTKPGSLTACAQTFSTALDNPQELALIKVSNPQAQQQIQGIISEITNGVGTLITALGGS
ncbi:MAG TPA: hypothetical protein VND65_19675 [Candidatus Binatia bacterium]|nr:hypothetical protein [Candidatus Binatia bacterium]